MKKVITLNTIVNDVRNNITVKQSIDQFPQRSLIYHTHFTKFEEISQEVIDYYYSIKEPFQGIYLLNCVYKDISILKIGKSLNVKHRFASIRGGNPLVEMIGYLHRKDIDTYETELYSKFKDYYFQGEWFHNEESIINYFVNHSDFKTMKERLPIINRYLKKEMLTKS